MKRSMIFLSMALVTLMALPGVALAQVNVSGTGTLEAEGRGLAVVQGNGTIVISGSGVLDILDIAGDARIDIQGGGTRELTTQRDRQVVRYRGFDGLATISGSHVVVRLRGTEIELNATGTGRAYLRGEGTYTLNGVSGEWTRAGVPLRLGQASTATP